MWLSIILTCAVLCQLAAAFVAIRLIRITGWRGAWICISIAILLMAGRRAFALSISSGVVQPWSDLSYELTGLIISIMMLIGICRIAPLFLAAKKLVAVQQEALARERELEAVRTTAGTIAHSINSPLTGIFADARMLKEQLPPASEQAEMVEEICQAVSAIKYTVAELERLQSLRCRTYRGARQIIDLPQAIQPDKLSA